MAVAARRMEIGVNARNSGMLAGRAVTYAVADPEWGIFDGPPAGAPARLPRAGRGWGWDGGRRWGRAGAARPSSAGE